MTFPMLNEGLATVTVVGFLLSKPITVFGIFCPYYYTKEIKDNCNGCAICNYNEVGKGVCEFKYLKNVFDPSHGLSCTLVDHCKEKKLCNDLPCVPLVGSFKCKCDSSRFGQLCQYPIEDPHQEKYAVVENILFTPLFTLDLYATITVLFSSTSSNMEVHVKTLLEHLVFDSRVCKEISITEYCATWYENFPTVCSPEKLKNTKCAVTITIPFPGHSFGPPERERVRPGVGDRYKYEVLAMQEKIKLEVYNNKHSNSDKPLLDVNITSLNILRSPHIEICSPMIYVRNGGETVFESLKIARRNEYEITCSYSMSTVPRCAGSGNLGIHWVMWKLGVNHDEISEKPVKVIYMERDLAFGRFSLDVGKYKLKVNMSVWVGSKESFEFVYTFFEIVNLDLEPLIVGGAEKTIRHNIHKLVLDGRLSKDPNLSPHEQKDGLLFYWKCDKEISVLNDRYSQGGTITYSGPFKANEWYTFNLTVHSKKDNSKSETTYQKIFMTSDPVPTLEIKCFHNCGSDKFESHPAEVFYFKVFITDIPLGVKPNNNFTWMYSSGKEESFMTVESIRQPNTPNSVLIVRENSLLEGQSYTFRVQGGSETAGQAKFIVRIAKKPDKFSCKLNVDVVKNYILKGNNVIIIKCDPITYKNMSPTYDFYDRYANDEGKGRLLVSGVSNKAYKVGLTRGRVVVEVTNVYGMTTEWEIATELIFETSPEVYINNELKELKRLAETSDSDYKTSTISAITDFIITEKHNLTNIPDILEYFLRVASEDEILVMEAAKLWANTIAMLATEGMKQGLTVMSVNYLGKVITKVTRILKRELKTSANESIVLTTDLILHISKEMIEACTGILLSKNEHLSNRTARQENNYALEHSYKESTTLMIKAVSRILRCFSLRLLPYQSPVTFKRGNISVWVKEDTPQAFSKWSLNQTSEESVPSVVISKSLALSLRKISEIIIVQVAIYDSNPYWWDQSLSIHTNAVDLSIIYKEGGKEPRIDQIPHPIEINLQHVEKNVEEILHGSVQQPDPNESIDVADMKVAVHRLRVQKTGRLYLEFFNLNESQVLKVLVLLNMRPDYDLMMSKLATNITKSDPYYYKTLRYPSEDDYDLYYLGILPDPKIPVGQFMNYSFKMSSKHCVSRQFDGWRTRGCKVNDIIIETKQFCCECEHLSIFAGFSDIPMNTIDLCTDHQLFLTTFNNPFAAVFVACLLLMYGIFLCWTLCKDSVDKYKQCASYLEDNVPDDQYPYLIAVYTGSKLFSGTTSNVGIMIKGDLSCSRYHILKSSLYKTQQRGEDNWYILFAPLSLGNLQCILLWIDYSGRNPDWFCNKVIIFDLLNNREYVFLVDSWFSAKQDENVEKITKAATSEDDLRADLAVDNLVFGFREAHIWLSVITRHPRSTVLRSQRLTVAFSGVMITMLVSCIFFKAEERLEDDAQYNLTMRMFIVGLVSMIMSSFLVNVIISLFRKTLIYRPFGEEEESVEALEEKTQVNESFVDEKKRRKGVKKLKDKGNNLFRCFNALLKIFVRRKKFVPVHMSVDVLGVARGQNVANLVWNIVTWFVCLSLIAISSYFIILYGLKFGRVKSLEWITTVGISLLQTMCIVTPLKILSLATMSGMMASKIYEVVTYRINLSLLQQYKKWLLRHDPEMEYKLAALRALPMYIPTNNTAILEKRARQIRLDDLWVVVDMLLIGLVAAIMVIQNETLWTTRYYWNNYQLTSLLRKGYQEEGIQVTMVTNLSQYPVFLEEKVFPIIYQEEWYNGQSFRPEENTTDDVISSVFSGTCKLIGLPRLRQLRIKSGLCKKPLFDNLPSYCPARLSEETEDTDFYGRGWVSRGRHEIFIKSSPWSYKNDTETYDSPFIGYSTLVYNGDGYVAELSMSRKVSSGELNYLSDENWLDRNTQVVFFELSLYNPNAGTFSWLISITESLHMDMLMNRVYVFSVSQEYKLAAIDVFLFCSLVMFSLRALLVINRRGIEHLFNSFWNIIEIVIVVLSVICAFLYVKNIKATSNYLEEYNSRKREEYFGFPHLLTNLAEIRIILIAIQIMLLCRFVKSWKFGKIYEIIFITLCSTWLSVSWIFVSLIVILFYYWRVFSYLLYSFIFSKNNLVVINNIDFKQVVKECNNIQCKMNPFVLCTVSYLAKALIIVVFLYIYRHVKAKFQGEEGVNICRALCPTKYINYKMEHDKITKKVQF